MIHRSFQQQYERRFPFGGLLLTRLACLRRRFLWIDSVSYSNWLSPTALILYYRLVPFSTLHLKNNVLCLISMRIDFSFDHQLLQPFDSFHEQIDLFWDSSTNIERVLLQWRPISETASASCRAESSLRPDWGCVFFFEAMIFVAESWKGSQAQLEFSNRKFEAYLNKYELSSSHTNSLFWTSLLPYISLKIWIFLY